jgi:chromate transporter
VQELARYFLKLGSTGFGGPVALVARMRRQLVEEMKLVKEADFNEGVALAQLAPGPLAAQLAMYLGWLDSRALGAAVVGIAFVLPSLVIVLILAELYVRAGSMPIIAMLFYGVGAAVIAVIARSGFRLARSMIQHDTLLWTIAIVNATSTALLGRESIALVFISGLVTLPRPKLVLSIVPLPVIFFFFAQSGLVVFGSGLAIVPFLHGGVVGEHHWLTEQQFLDAVAVSLLTPGPVVITVAFIGFLVAGLPGGLVAAVGVFLPAYLIVVLVAPRFQKLSLKNLAKGVTAAAVGALLGAVIVMATRTLVDAPTIIIALASLLVLTIRPRTPEPIVLGAAAVAGVILR